MPWFDFVSMLLWLFFGGCDIACAIYYFKKKYYIRFGVAVMWTILMAAEVVQFAFKY